MCTSRTSATSSVHHRITNPNDPMSNCIEREAYGATWRRFGALLVPKDPDDGIRFWIHIFGGSHFLVSSALFFPFLSWMAMLSKVTAFFKLSAATPLSEISAAKGLGSPLLPSVASHPSGLKTSISEQPDAT